MLNSPCPVVIKKENWIEGGTDCWSEWNLQLKINHHIFWWVDVRTGRRQHQSEVWMGETDTELLGGSAEDKGNIYCYSCVYMRNWLAGFCEKISLIVIQIQLLLFASRTWVIYNSWINFNHFLALLTLRYSFGLANETTQGLKWTQANVSKTVSLSLFSSTRPGFKL